jgi:hypothetical protein
LSAVRKHWVRSWQYLADVSGGPGPNYAHLARFGSATFGFDGHNRVGGVSIRTDHQSWQPIVMPPC